MSKPVSGQLMASTGRTGALNGNPAARVRPTLPILKRGANTLAEVAELALICRENLDAMEARGLVGAEAREIENAKRQAARHICPDDDDVILDNTILDDGSGANRDRRENNNRQRATGQSSAGQRDTRQSSTGRTPTCPL